MSKTRWTAKDIPDQSGKVAIVTGANSGLGFESAMALAAKGATVVLACRSQQKAETAKKQILQEIPQAKLNPGVLDLGSLSSVKTFSDEILETYPKIDVLLNNAGIMGVPQGKTKDGFESQFGVNHLGHFALTGHLIERLLQTPGSRIVNVSSLAANNGTMNFEDLMHEKNYVPFDVYGQSKLSNQLFTYALQERLEGIGASTIAVAAHPGGSSTNLSAGAVINPFMKFMFKNVFRLIISSAAQGAYPQLYAATEKDVAGASYWGPDGFREIRGYPKQVAIPPQALDKNAQNRLWEASEKLTGVSYDLFKKEGV